MRELVKRDTGRKHPKWSKETERDRKPGQKFKRYEG